MFGHVRICSDEQEAKEYTSEYTGLHDDENSPDQACEIISLLPR